MNQINPTIFHTGSVAEYHDYALRILLSKYVKSLNTPDSHDISNSILTDDAAFAKAVQSYQHIVTHYLCAKMELWMGLFMNPTHGVTSGLLTNEFATGRGAIHFQSILYTSQQYLPVNDITNDDANEEHNMIPNITYNENTLVSPSS